MATLAEIRAKLKAAERTEEGNSNTGGDRSVYPFWTIKNGGEAVFRFLPDGDPNNMFFWVEKAVIKLPFNGIKNGENRRVLVHVPCVEMYNDGSVCPILTEVRPWYKDPSLKEIANSYWKKRSYIFNGFVVEDGLKEPEPPENPIRKLLIGPQIYKLIHSALVDPELEELPTDFVNGLDFRMRVTMQGENANYSTSSWSRRTRPLSDVEMSAIDKYGLPNLSDFLPKKPSEIDLKVMKEMFEASVDGQLYDAERWGKYFRPQGIREDQLPGLNSSAGFVPAPVAPTPSYTAPAAPAAPAYTAPVAPAYTAPVVEESAPWDEPVTYSQPTAATPAPAITTDNKADQILQMIRNRNAQ